MDNTDTTHVNVEYEIETENVTSTCKVEKRTSVSEKKFHMKRPMCIIISLIIIVLLVLAVSFVVLYIVKPRHTTEQSNGTDMIKSQLPSTTPTGKTSSSSTSLISTTTKGPKECPSDWLMLGESCYFLSDSKLTWNDAFIHCLKLSAFLVEINDETEDNFLIGKVRKAKETFWIGLADSFKENKWTWKASDTTLTKDSYSNWSPGEPNNNCKQGEGCEGENCVSIVSDPKYDWNDDKCHYEYNYICEM